MTCIDTGDQVRGVIVTVKGKNLCVNEYMIECIKLFPLDTLLLMAFLKS